MNPLIDLTSDDEGKSSKEGSSTREKNKMLSEMLVEAMVEVHDLKGKLHKEKIKSADLAQKVEALTNDLQAKNFENSMLNMRSAGNLQMNAKVKSEPGNWDNNVGSYLQNPMQQKTPARSKTPRYSSPKTPPYPSSKARRYSRSSKISPRYPIYGSSRNSTKTPSRQLYNPPRRNTIRTPPPTPPPSMYSEHRSPYGYTPPQRRSFKTPSKFNGTRCSFVKQKSPAKGPKYMIENVDKSIEDTMLYDYFKGFGVVSKVNVREKGIEKLNVEKCTAFLQFESDPKEGFLEATHTLNDSPLTIREFNDGKDTEKIDDDWNESEINDKSRKETSQSHSPPRKFQRSESRGRVDVHKQSQSVFRSKNGPRNRSPSSSSVSSHNQKTRTIAIKLMFQRWTENLLCSYFSKFGEIDEFKIPPGKTRGIMFLKYKEFKSAEDALSYPQHFIEGEKYWINAAEDR